MATKKFADFEGKKHYAVWVNTYGIMSWTADLDGAKKDAAKLAKTYINKDITIYLAIATAEEEVVPLKWNELA